MREIVREFGFSKNLNNVLKKLSNLFKVAIKQQHEIIVLCLGSSKIVGDCFAPTVGDFLLSKNLPFWIYGNSNSNVNARNIKQTLDLISLIHKNNIILVVDSLATTNPSLIGDVILSDEYVGLNKQVFVDADLFLYATTTYLGFQNLHAKINITTSLASTIANTLECAFNLAKRNIEFDFLNKCVC